MTMKKKTTTTKKNKPSKLALTRWKYAKPLIVDLRQVIVINDDLKMSPGKVASQAAHAAVAGVCATSWNNVMEWLHHGPTKIVVRATEKQMRRVIRLAKKHKLACAPFVDAAPTTEGTANKMTALAIGPYPKDVFAPVTGDLKLY